MANTDNPTGFINPEALDGGPIIARTRKSAGTAIFRGDPVKYASGRVSPCTAAADIPDGIAAHYAPATADTPIQVYEDLHRLTFECQVDDATITGDTFVGNTADVIFTHAGNATTGLSGVELDGDKTAGAAVSPMIQIHKLITRPDNDYGSANPRVRVKFIKDRTQTVAA